MAGPLPGLFRSVTSKGLAGYDVLADAGSVAEAAVGEAVVADGVVTTSVLGVTVEAFGSAVAAVLDLPVIVIIVIILVLLRVLEGIILFIPSKIPGIMGGNQIYGATKAAFGFIDHLENAAISFTVGAVESCFRGMLNAFSFLLGLVAPWAAAPHSTPVPNHTGYATEDEVQRLQAQINTLNKAVGSLEFTLSPVATPFNPPVPAPGGTTTTTQVTQVIKVGVPQTVWDQIHQLEAQAHAHQTSITDLYSRTDRLTTIATQLQSEFKNLTGEIHAVRAVSASWQDIEQQLENLGGLTTQFIDETSAELGKVVAVQTQLSPLTLLLEPGIRGLRNLRKLEDNICQCPKFANIPNELGTALAVLEFVENG